jgi:hypothetical protein
MKVCAVKKEGFLGASGYWRIAAIGKAYLGLKTELRLSPGLRSFPEAAP